MAVVLSPTFWPSAVPDTLVTRRLSAVGASNDTATAARVSLCVDMHLLLMYKRVYIDYLLIKEGFPPKKFQRRQNIKTLGMSGYFSGLLADYCVS